MPKYLKKKKIILVLLLLIVLSGFFLAKADLKTTKLEFKKVITVLSNKFSVLGIEIPYFFPRYPQRLIYLASEMSLVGEELVSLNKELNTSTEECNCKFAQSQCLGGGLTCQPGSVKAFGEPCLEREKIEERQSEIREKAEKLSVLKNLLVKEMETGLERELETLRPEVAEELKTKLNNLLTSSENIISLAEKNRKLPSNCSAENCGPVCNSGDVFKIKECLSAGTGEQKPIKLKFKEGVKLDNLKLGKLEFKSVNFSLPEEIPLSKLPELSPLVIPVPEMVIAYPETPVDKLEDLELQLIILHPIQPSLPQPLPGMTLLPPKLPSSSYQCEGGENIQVEESSGIDWYFQTFAWLSEKCQELPAMKDKNGIPTEKFAECFDIENVPTTIVTECTKCFVSPGCSPPQICQSIGKPEAACKNLFSQENEPIPSDCNTNPIETLQKKCIQLRDGGREEAPEPCKLLPLFTGKIEAPGQLAFLGQEASCPSQKIIDYPSSISGWPASPPTTPKISFPDIIIPDIKLPHFRLWPFLDIKLPNLIFEDLIIPDIELLDLDDYQDEFPPLKPRLPVLNLPPVKVPPLSLCPADQEVFIEGVGLKKIPCPEIKIDPIQLPPVPFTFPQLTGLSLLPFTGPEIGTYKIPLPRPKFIFSFEGIDIDILSLVGSFIKNALGIPDFSLCINFDLVPIPLKITYPDYYFSWSKYPSKITLLEIKIEQGEEIKTFLKEITDKTGSVEKVFNKAFQKQVQEKLDQASPKIKKKVEENCKKELDQFSLKIQKKLEENLKKAKVENGLLKIPPTIILAEDIKCPATPLAEETDLPEKISIFWPEELKKFTLPKPLIFELPDIPLSELSYSKKFSIKVPGFQAPSLNIDLGNLGNLGECLAGQPSGKNPCPITQFQTNLGEIKAIREEINKISQDINSILE